MWTSSRTCWMPASRGKRLCTSSQTRVKSSTFCTCLSGLTCTWGTSRIRQQILEHKKKILKNGNPGCCPDEPESTHRFRAHMRRDPDLSPEGQLHTGFSYLQEWKWPSVTSWDLIRAAHSTSSAIQEYSTYSGISHLLRKYLSVEKGHAFFPAFAGLSFLLEMSGKRFSLEETPQEKQR
ncbi:uncharacterized protein [Chlorocebus sabaeus]|uniref:uncharacterized protein isoform X2 n=1 Tax=Chlorocebus sabaeus TaxID=60711 RepID=UPI003BFA048A